jgi:predicted SAM-dependent methyltransferase
MSARSVPDINSNLGRKAASERSTGSAVWRLVKSRTSVPVRVALRDLVRELRLQRLHRAGVRRARRSPLPPAARLNLGCGQNLKEGWTNIDLFEDRADLRLDLREPLPFPSNSASLIYSEHVFEHLSYPCIHDSMGWSLEAVGAPSEAMQLLRESYRVLIPGGRFTVGVPDAERAARLYLRGEYETWGPSWVDTPMHFLNYVFRQGREHKYAYDEATLCRMLESVGFVNVARRAFCPGLDSEHRKNDTLYVDAIKPDSVPP